MRCHASAAFDGEIGIVKPTADAHQISTVRLYPNRTEEIVADEGDNENPAVSLNGGVVVWDSDGDPLDSGFPGRQVFRDIGVHRHPGEPRPDRDQRQPGRQRHGWRGCIRIVGGSRRGGESGGAGRSSCGSRIR